MPRDKKAKGDIIEFTQSRRYRSSDGKDSQYSQSINCQGDSEQCTVTVDKDGRKTRKKINQADLFNSLVTDLTDQISERLPEDTSSQEVLQPLNLDGYHQSEIPSPDVQHEPAMLANSNGECPFQAENPMSLMGQPYLFLDSDGSDSDDSDAMSNNGASSHSDLEELLSHLHSQSDSAESDSNSEDSHLSIVRHQPVSQIRQLQQQAEHLPMTVPEHDLQAAEDDVIDMPGLLGVKTDRTPPESEDGSDASSVASILEAIHQARQQPATANQQSDREPSDTDSDDSLIGALDLARQRVAEAKQQREAPSKHQLEADDADASDDSSQTPSWIQQIEGETQRNLLQQLLSNQGSRQVVKQQVSPSIVPASKLRKTPKKALGKPKSATPTKLSNEVKLKSKSKTKAKSKAKAKSKDKTKTS